MSRKRVTGVNVGGSSILVIFVLLCLTTFATLSLVSANASYSLAKKASYSASEYYSANAAAEERLAEIDGRLREASLLAGSESGYFTLVERYCEQSGFPASYKDGEISYEVPVNDTQVLAVSLRVNYSLDETAPRFSRERWQVVNTADWELENGGFDLWGGEDDSLLFGGE